MAQACIYALLKMPRSHHCISCQHVFTAGDYEHWKSVPHRYIPGEKYWVICCAHCKLMDVDKDVVKLVAEIRDMKEEMRKMRREIREEMDAMDYQASWNRYHDYDIQQDQQATPWIPHTHQSSQTDAS